MTRSTRSLTVFVALLAILALPAVARPGNNAPTHRARLLDARERLLTPRVGATRVVGTALVTPSNAFDWSAAGVGLAAGVAICLVSLGAVIGASWMRRSAISPPVKGHMS